ncbi:uncharacterized protein LOC135695310 [Rhopilema esculentum]|uniref:uncharacterized protein LOC135695310 n=1 Tax=Rhopilema esculentum TaxID=499914 RepID=UPI0031E06F3F
MKFIVATTLLLLVSVLHYAFGQQLAPGQLKQKVDEIAKAYAEGYKAAINAIRSRNMIPRTPIVANIKPKMSPRSFIPKPVAQQVVRNFPSANGNGFFIPARQITVNGVEKSGIPRPPFRAQYSPEQKNTMRQPGHTVVERSAAPPPLLGKFMQQQQGRSLAQQFQKKSEVPANNAKNQPDEAKAEEMARMNAAARSRNVYFDAIGGDPYGSASGVLSRQTINFHRSRRSTGEYQMRNRLRRQTRSRVPYLGQDLDKMGIVRAVPVMGGSQNFNQNALPSFMKVHAAEFGSLTSSQDQSIEAPRQVQPIFQRSEIPFVPQAFAKRANSKRDVIERLNRAARHRNVYLDSYSNGAAAGLGGVLSRQNFLLSKHKRRFAEEDY